MLAALISLASTSHVAMRYVDGQPGPIRNAGSATGNGRGSVAGACGGNAAFGANGVGTVTDGQEVTLNINYAAGHNSPNNRFRMAYSCAGTGQNDLANAPMLTAAANGCTATVAGAPATYAADGVNAADAIVQGGYSITCTLPLQGGPQDECTMSLLDQRDWGGCVDVQVLAANALAPPAPPPAPIIPNTGSYPFSRATMVDSSAATFNCCPLESGSLEIGQVVVGAPTITGQLTNARATSCRTSSDITAPESATHELNEQLTFNLVGTGGNRYVATTLAGGSWAGQTFEISVENGLLDFHNVGGDQPIICDGFSRATAGGGGGGGVGGGGAANTASGDGGGSTTGILVVIVILLLAGGAFYVYRKKKNAPLPPPSGAYPPTVTRNVAAPPPPAGGLPAGWVEMSDPTSGAKYFYNQVRPCTRPHVHARVRAVWCSHGCCSLSQGTGETTWTRPGGNVA